MIIPIIAELVSLSVMSKHFGAGPEYLIKLSLGNTTEDVEVQCKCHNLVAVHDMVLPVQP